MTLLSIVTFYNKNKFKNRSGTVENKNIEKKNKKNSSMLPKAHVHLQHIEPDIFVQVNLRQGKLFSSFLLL